MLNTVSCNPLIFFSLLWLTNLFLKTGFCRTESQYYSPFTKVEHTNVSSHLLFLKQLKCLSFLLLTPLSGLFDSYSSKIPLQNIFSLSTVALGLFSLPTNLYTSLYNFSCWSCLLHLSHILFSLVSSPRTLGFFAHIHTIPVFWYLLSRFIASTIGDLKDITLRESLEIAS